MNIKKILCPIDFSKNNDMANDYASAFAAATGAEIVYLHVADQGTFNGSYGFAMQRTADRLMKKLVCFQPTKGGIRHRHRVENCSLIADTIVNFANENEIDLIIMATPSRNSISRTFLGSVSASVLRNATCAVATLRPACRARVKNAHSVWTTESVSVDKQRDPS